MHLDGSRAGHWAQQTVVLRLLWLAGYSESMWAALLELQQAARMVRCWVERSAEQKVHNSEHSQAERSGAQRAARSVVSLVVSMDDSKAARWVDCSVDASV